MRVVPKRARGRSSALLFLLLSAFAAPALRAQNLERSVPLDDGDPASPDKAYGLAVDPDGVHVYAPLAGNLSLASPQTANNDDVFKVDVLTGSIVAVQTVGLYPEEVAVAVDAAGAAREVFVSNGTDGTISCLSPDLATTWATVTLSPCFGAVFLGAFPYGLLLSPDQTRLYVTTAGGCDIVDVIDVDPTSATYRTLVGSFVVPGAGGRPSWRAYPEMVLPATQYDVGFTRSDAGFVKVDVTNPTSAVFHPVTPAQPFVYHSANEAVVIAGDRVLLPIYGGTTIRLFEADLASGAVVRTLVVPPSVTSNTLHGLAVSPDGALAAVTSLTGGDTLLVDVASFAVVAMLDHGATSQPNDAAFLPDGSRLVVTLQNAGRLDVYKDLPGYDLALDLPATVAQGASATVGVRRAEHGRPYAVFVSVVPGPFAVGPYVLALGPPFFELFSGVADVRGEGSATIPVPVDPVLSGLALYFQAATVDRDGDLRLSNGAQTIVL
ncbi:MAG TPA: hypothetical protein VEI02_00050 [Planctomycetota bacterium]|nr:hypothetical protein [Planctomycetota bacterium]